MSDGQGKKIYKGYKLTSKREFLKKLGYTPILKRWVEGPICEKTKQIQESIIDLDEKYETKKHDSVFYSNFMYIPEGRRTVKKIFNKKQIDKNWLKKNSSKIPLNCTRRSTSVVKWNEKVVVCDSDCAVDLVDGQKSTPGYLSPEEKINMVNYNILLDWADEHYYNNEKKIWEKKKTILTPKEIFDKTVLLFVTSSNKKDGSKSEWITFFIIESLAYCNDHDSKHNTHYEKELIESVKSLTIFSTMRDLINIIKTLTWIPEEIKQRGDPPEEKKIERLKNE